MGRVGNLVWILRSFESFDLFRRIPAGKNEFDRTGSRESTSSHPWAGQVPNLKILLGHAGMRGGRAQIVLRQASFEIYETKKYFRRIAKCQRAISLNGYC